LNVISNHGRLEKVPVAPFAGLFTAKHSKIKFSELLNDASVYVDAEVKAYEDFQYDAVWGPSLNDIGPSVGMQLEIPEDGPINYKPCITNSDDLLKLGPYSPENPCWTEYKANVIQGLKSKIGDDVPVIVQVMSFFETAAAMLGLENFFILMITDPEFVHDVLEYSLEQTIKNYQYLCKAGADVLVILGIIICSSDP